MYTHVMAIFFLHTHVVYEPPQVSQDSGVLVFHFQAPLCFVNSVVFRRRLEIATKMDKRQISRVEEKGCLQLCTSKVWRAVLHAHVHWMNTAYV